MLHRNVACGLALCGWVLAAWPADWPRWRGPNFDGISPETGWLTQWPAEGPRQLWKANVGIGYSSFSVANGRLYTMGNTEETDSIYCLDAATGRELWRHSYPCSSKDPNGYPGPRSTPTVDGERVYAVSRNGHFFCLEAATGKVVWSKEFPKDYQAKVPTWGFAGSPLVEGNAVICEVGGAGASVVAFDKQTGRELWRAGDDTIGYSSIVPFDHRGQRALAVFNAAGLVARRAKDGAELWRHPWKTSWDVNAATPILADGKAFISSGYNKGCALLDLSGDQPRVLWEHRKMRNHVATCVLWQGHLYGFDENQFKCLDWATGEEKWADRTYGKGSLMLAGKHFIVYSDKGRVAVVAPSPEGLKEIVGYQVLSGKDTWAVPVLANGRLYCRSQQDLVCLDVSGR
jgi:outer membrane protein assembly factor BamB